MGGLSLLPRRITGRNPLLVWEAHRLADSDGGLANGVGLANSDIRLTDPGGVLANAHIGSPYPDSRLSNSVGLADPDVRLTDSIGGAANAHIRLTQSNGALSDAIGFPDSDRCLADASIRFASPTC